MSAIRWHRGVIIEPKNYAGMYSARINGRYGGGIRVAADTVAGIKQLISETLTREGNPEQ